MASRHDGFSSCVYVILMFFCIMGILFTEVPEIAIAIVIIIVIFIAVGFIRDKNKKNK